MIGIPLGIAYSNAFEWVIHKFVLHGLGRDKKNFWSFHWHEHHKRARKQDMYDESYEGTLWEQIKARNWNARTKEAAGLVAAGALHAPLLPVMPFFTLTVWACAANYYRVHKRAHLDPAWGKEHLPWHVDHHMGKDQDANWCVTWPMTDWLLGTREKYVGTEAHAKDEARRQQKQQEAAASPAPAPAPAPAASSSSTNTEQSDVEGPSLPEPAVA